MRTPRLSGLLLLPFVLTSYLPLSATEAQPDIPFEVHEGFAIIVRGSIEGQTGLHFLVDTGAVPSAIHERLAQKLNLRGPREAFAIGAQSTSVERVQLRGLRLGSSTEDRSVSAVVVDLTAIEIRLHVSLDGVVGLDVLGNQDLTIDYAERRIRFGAPKAGGQAISFELRHEAGAPYVVVPCQINSRVVSLLLDTGSSSLTLFNVDGLAAAGLRTAGSGETVDAGGRRSTQQGELRIVQFSLREWKDVPVTLINNVDTSARRDFDGLLGPVALGIRRLTLDFSNKTMFVEFKR